MPSTIKTPPAPRLVTPRAIARVIVLARWAEHVVQAIQIWVLGWPVPESRGVLGGWFPWLV